MTRLAAEIFPAAEALQIAARVRGVRLVERIRRGGAAARERAAVPERQPAPDRPQRGRPRRARRRRREARRLVRPARPRHRRDRDAARGRRAGDGADGAAGPGHGHRARRRDLGLRHAPALPRPPARVHQGRQRGDARHRDGSAPARDPEVSRGPLEGVLVPARGRGDRVGRGSGRLRGGGRPRGAGLLPRAAGRRAAGRLARVPGLARLPARGRVELRRLERDRAPLLAPPSGWTSGWTSPASSRPAPRPRRPAREGRSTSTARAPSPTARSGPGDRIGLAGKDGIAPRAGRRGPRGALDPEGRGPRSLRGRDAASAARRWSRPGGSIACSLRAGTPAGRTSATGATASAAQSERRWE